MVYFPGRFCFLIALCSVLEFYKRVLLAFFAGLSLMDGASHFKLLLSNYDDFGCGFFIFGCFCKLCNVLALFSVFLLGFKVLQFIGYYKFKGQSIEGRKWVSLMCSKGDDFNGVKNKPVKGGTTRVSRASVKGSGDHSFEEIDELVSCNCGFQNVRSDNDHNDVGYEEGDEECCDEDQVFDVMSLRKMVEFQRRRASMAGNELEKERMAASSATDEAMSMILRLQNEKSSLQIQANQFQRFAEEKKLHDQEVIQSLQWIIMKHESERILLEERLRLCREKLRLYVKGEEWDQFDSICPTPSAASHCSYGQIRVDDDEMITPLDLDSSPM